MLHRGRAVGVVILVISIGSTAFATSFRLVDPGRSWLRVELIAFDDFDSVSLVDRWEAPVGGAADVEVGGVLVTALDVNHISLRWPRLQYNGSVPSLGSFELVLNGFEAAFELSGDQRLKPGEPMEFNSTRSEGAPSGTLSLTQGSEAFAFAPLDCSSGPLATCFSSSGSGPQLSTSDLTDLFVRDASILGATDPWEKIVLKAGEVGFIVRISLSISDAEYRLTPRPNGVIGWGDNSHGYVTPPDTVNGKLGTASEVAAGYDYSCAIQTGSGAVVCWGNNDYLKATPPPSVNGTAGTATAIALGQRHSCAIQAVSQAVVCWGGTYSGNSGEAMPPDAVNGVAGSASSIAVGRAHSCAIQAASGAVVCWGANQDGQATPPNAVNGTEGTAIAIAAGAIYTCAIEAGTGAVVCWGDNYHGQLETPPSVNGTAGTAQAISANVAATCAIQTGSGGVVCWGNDDLGQSSPPASVDGTEGTASAIAVGGDFACAIKAQSGGVVCWGDNSAGKATPPVSVAGTFGTATGLAAGLTHALAIRVPEPIAALQAIAAVGALALLRWRF